MKAKRTRPIDVKDTLWSYIGKDALDAAAEGAWEVMRSRNIVWNCADDTEEGPYHIQSTPTQDSVQRLVLHVLGTTAVVLLRQRAKELRRNGASADEYTALLDLADELEGDHG
jgi:hypothetical protein